MPVPRQTALPAPWALLTAWLCLGLAACGGGSGGAEPGGAQLLGTASVQTAPAAPGLPGQISLVRALTEPAGASCAAGGLKVQFGLDGNANGVLDASEVTDTNFVCNGTPGALGAAGAGTASVLRTSSEPPGANCASGGQRLQTGLDANLNTLLDDAEVRMTSYACNGAAGAAGPTGPAGSAGPAGPAGSAGPAGPAGSAGPAGPRGEPGSAGAGTPGAAGLTSLVRSTPEPAGANCAAGGVLVQIGLDANGNGTLEPGEITSSSYACNGTAGTPGTPGTSGSAGTPGTVGLNSLILTTPEPLGVNCAAGGLRVQTGLDLDRSGTLQAGEVTATSYVCSPASPGSILTAVSGLDTGKTLTVVLNGGAPIGIAANGFASLANGLAAGTAYTVTVGSQPARQTCSLSGATGTVVAGGVATVIVTCAASPLFAYLANIDNDDISAYRINPGTGELTAVGTPIAAGSRPISVAVDPSGKFVYVANTNSDSVSVLRIDAASGALTAVGAPVAAGNSPISLAVDPSGRFVYVANFNSNSVWVYSIDAGSGALTAVGAPVATGNSPISLAVDPSGKFVYAANASSNNISAYRIDTASGALTSVGALVAAGASPRSVVVDPSGKFVYVANTNSNNVSALRIDSGSGALTAVGTPVAAGNNPISLAVDPSGKFVYAANRNSNNVSVLRIDASTGALTFAATAAAGNGPVSIAISQRP